MSTLKLIINNSISKLENLTVEQYHSLRKVLQYRLAATSSYFSADPTGGIRYLIDKKGNFATGLLYLAKEWLLSSKLPHHVEDKRIQPRGKERPYRMNLEVTPYQEQIQGAAAALKHRRGYIVAPTGFGKSILLALIINTLKVKTMVVVPNLGLKQQITETLTELFGEDKVGPNKDINVQNIQAMKVKDKANYDCVIIDEYHHGAAKTYRDLNKKAWNNVYFRIGLTATPFRSQDHERLLLESLLSQKIFEVSYVNAVAKGYIVPMEAYICELPKKPVSGHTWAAVYKECVVENQERNKIISQMLKRLRSAKRSTLCLVKEIRHGEILSELTGIPFANGQDSSSDELIKTFCKGSSCLIATTGVCGEGRDTKPAEYIIIAGLGKSKPAFMQQCGRAFRRYPGKESCKVILFRDESHKWTLTHYKKQVSVLLTEYNVKPEKL
jgi:superfamily II DNA or RNA helicase